jgi:ribulose-5-phosphate 4-epimerase/fuculose-1-phosphate aldolase
VAIGKNLDEARSVIESLEEWAKVLTVCKIFSGNGM